MRPFIIIFCSLSVLVGAYGVYWWMHKPGAPSREIMRRAQTQPVKAPPRRPGGSQLGAIDEGWIYSYDKQTGRLDHRFRVKRSTEAPDGRRRVDLAEIEFFLGGEGEQQQILRIVGKTGFITMLRQQDKKGAEMGASVEQTPSRGDLHDVVITLHPRGAAPAGAMGEATMTMTMNNVSFDNEAMKIYTQGFTDPATGKTCTRDMVPITERGEDYDFDGLGLEMTWNERDHRLDYLKVFHGQKLVIKKPGTLMGEQNPTAGNGSGRVGPAHRSPDGGQCPPYEMAPLPGALVSTDKRAGAALAPADPKTRPDRPSPRSEGRAPRPTTRLHPGENLSPAYRAIFEQDVRIVQDPDLVATGEIMQVDFRQANKATTQPAAGDSGRGASPLDQRRDAAATSALPAGEGTGSTGRDPGNVTTLPSAGGGTGGTGPATTQATTVPATQPAEPPVTITWTGPLTIRPLLQDTSDRIDAGESILQLTGNPVKIHRGTGDAFCALFIYRTADKSVEMNDAPGAPVIIKDEGSTVVTPHVEFSRQDRIAHLLGTSSADFLARTSSTQPTAGDKLHAQWSEQCTLYMIDGPNNQLTIDRAALRGNVVVNHPQILLKSRNLNLGFAPTTRPATREAAREAALADAASRPASRPSHTMQATLRSLDASEDVHCELTDESKNTQTIDSQHLQVLTGQTPDGRFYPRQVLADGSVHAVDPKQDLRCGYLSIGLVPSTRPATQPATGPADDRTVRTELQSLVAHDNVHVITKDPDTHLPNGSADADQLFIISTDGKESVRLVGMSKPAVATHEKSIITGGEIQFVPDLQQARVPGPGTLVSEQQDAPDAPPRPIEVKWQTSMNADGAANQVDCVGRVEATSLQADGTLYTAKGDRARIMLVDAPPATQPATAPTTGPASAPARKRSSTKPAKSGADLPTANKVVREITLESNNAAGAKGVTLNSTLADDKGQLLQGMQLDSSLAIYNPILKRLLVPVPGAMRLEDHRKPDPAAKPAAGGDPLSNPGEMRGNTAFIWSKKLDYDESTRKAWLVGDVAMEHRGEDAADKPFKLWGDSFEADLEPIPQPATRAAKAQGEQSPHMRVKTLHGAGHIIFISNNQKMLANTIDYDPAKHLFTARGTPNQPVIILDDSEDPLARGMELGRVDELQFDTEKWQIVNSSRIIKNIRRAP